MNQVQRELTGHYVPLPSAGGEKARAFVPDPLPPKPALAYDTELEEQAEKAMLALGRLDGMAAVLVAMHPDAVLEAAA